MCFSVMWFTVLLKAVRDVVDLQQLLVILFLYFSVDCPGHHFYPPLPPVLDVFPADRQADSWNHAYTVLVQYITVWYMNGKLTVRQSSSVQGRLRCRRASTAHDGAPSPTERPWPITNGVSIATQSVGCHPRVDSGSTACGSVLWPLQGHSASSGVDDVMVIVSKMTDG